MKKVSLIKKIEYQAASGDVYPVTFDIESNYDRDKLKRAYSNIRDNNLVFKDSIGVGDNCFTIYTELDNIPAITKILLENNIVFYGIYVLYDNFLEMREGK